MPGKIRYHTYLYAILLPLVLLLSWLYQRYRLLVVLSTSSIDCCSTNCFVAIGIRRMEYGHGASRTKYILVLVAAVRTIYVLLYRIADGDACFSCISCIFFIFTSHCF